MAYLVRPALYPADPNLEARFLKIISEKPEKVACFQRICDIQYFFENYRDCSKGLISAETYFKGMEIAIAQKDRGVATAIMQAADRWKESNLFFIQNNAVGVRFHIELDFSSLKGRVEALPWM